MFAYEKLTDQTTKLSKDVPDKEWSKLENNITINFKFSIGEDVYDRSRKQNGIIVGRQYIQFIERNYYEYSVCFNDKEQPDYEWVSGSWLVSGNRIA